MRCHIKHASSCGVTEPGLCCLFCFVMSCTSLACTKLGWTAWLPLCPFTHWTKPPLETPMAHPNQPLLGPQLFLSNGLFSTTLLVCHLLSLQHNVLYLGPLPGPSPCVYQGLSTYGTHLPGGAYHWAHERHWPGSVAVWGHFRQPLMLCCCQTIAEYNK